MAKGKLILICQSGGEFIKKGDGTLSYEGGEANAVNINNETQFEDLKLKLAEMSDLDQKTISIKYFLPGNQRNLITLRNDKDLKRMTDFHGNSVTADIFVDGKKGFDHAAVKVNSSRDRGVKLADTVKPISTPPTAASSIIHDAKPLSSYPCSDANPTAADNISDSQTFTSSPTSSEHDSEFDSDYRPRSNVAKRAAGYDTGTSPAITVKKRRRRSTASWTIGENGPTIVTDDGGERKTRRKSNNQGRRNSNKVERTDDEDAFCNDDLPENLVATWKSCITGVGQDFKSVKEFREALQKFAVAHRFGFKLKKNDTNRASGICVEEGCTWSIHASWVPTSESFRIKKFNNSHTCRGESWKNAHPAKNLLVSVIKQKLRDSPHHKPKEIAKSISRDFGIELKYTQVRRGIEDAREQLQGSHKKSYSRLPWFCEKAVETNPGSFVKLVTNDEKRLQGLFVAFKPCVQSFQNGCRPILFLNGTSLKSKYQESLLTATAVDADDGFFLVAFAIVDVENEANWRWFLEQLKSAMSTTTFNIMPLTFVSDMDKEVKKCLHEVFENSHHGYSIHHLIESFKRNLKGPFQGEGRGVLPGKLLDAAHAIRMGGYKKFTEQIRHISPNAYDWVIMSEPEHWASALFKGEQYNYITHNVGELYAKLMDEIRESTIMQKIEKLIEMMREVMDNRRVESSKWTTKLTPSREKLIQDEGVKSHGLRVFISSNVLFEVHDDSTHVVDIEKWECTCLEWKGKGIPCRHAIAALRSAGKSVYGYCTTRFTVESYRLTYSESINPIPHMDETIGKEGKEEGKVEGKEEGKEEAKEVGKEEGKEEGKEDGKEEGKEEGIKEGKEGKEDGIEEGKEEGIEEGKEEEEGEKEEEMEGEKAGEAGDSCNVPQVVLPPIPSKPKKEDAKMEADPDKRTVTCSKCKEPGHNKASCKATS